MDDVEFKKQLRSILRYDAELFYPQSIQAAKIALSILYNNSITSFSVARKSDLEALFDHIMQETYLLVDGLMAPTGTEKYSNQTAVIRLCSICAFGNVLVNLLDTSAKRQTLINLYQAPSFEDAVIEALKEFGHSKLPYDLKYLEPQYYLGKKI